MVSQPLPAKWLCKEITRLEKRVGAWEHNSTTGIHVHVNKAWFTEAKAKAVAKVVNGLSYTAFAQLFGREPNYYCRQRADGSRYCAINTTNKATIEFRMWRSGDAKWAQQCVRMAEFMVENAFSLTEEKLFAFRDLLDGNY